MISLLKKLMANIEELKMETIKTYLMTFKIIQKIKGRMVAIRIREK